MRLIATLTCLALLGALPAQANSFTAVNRLTVNPVSASEFEVIESNGAGARQIWCAAAEYNERVLGNQRETELIVKTKRGPSITQPGRKGVVFTNNPANVSATITKSVSVSLNTPGMSLPSHHARTFCRDTFSRTRR